jgi:ATP-dependent Clp protease adaptor protein ClpS
LPRVQEPRTHEETLTQNQLREPVLYRVIMHNDHYTTMEFVIEVLMKIFHKPLQEAERLMVMIHEQGSAMVGLYTHEIAATKVQQVTQLAKQNEFPLRVTIEEDQ